MTSSRYRARFATAAAAALVLFSVPTAWAVATPPKPSPKPPGDQVMRLNWTITEVREGDVPPAGLSTGDTFHAAFKLTGKIRGTADYACSHVGTRAICTGILRLPDGDIYVATGPIDDSLPAAIQGGTFAYQGIRGQFTKTAKPDGTGTYTLTFRK